MRSSGPQSGGSSGALRGQHSREGVTRFPDGQMSRGQALRAGRPGGILVGWSLRRVQRPLRDFGTRGRDMQTEMHRGTHIACLCVCSPNAAHSPLRVCDGISPLSSV